MNKKYCQWKDEEVKSLFNKIENCEKNGKCLSKAFIEYALLTGRKPNSVRNYYYSELNELLKNEDRRIKLEIDISKHKKNEPKFFTQEETKTQLSEILRLKSLGYSIRKACLKIANGNIEQMVRLQNKYRIVLKKEPKLLFEIENNLKEKGFAINLNLPKNVISMPTKRTHLSESEINSLFLGLVKLIKNSARNEANLELQKETEFANNTLRQTLVNLSGKEMQLKELRKNFEQLKSEKQKLDGKIKNLRIENAQLLEKVGTKKMNSLKNFTNKLEKQIKQKV